MNQIVGCDSDNLRPARGVINGIIGGGCLWALAVILVYYFL